MRETVSGKALFDKLTTSDNLYHFDLKGEHEIENTILGSTDISKFENDVYLFEISIYTDNHHNAAKIDNVYYDIAVVGTFVHELQHTETENMKMAKEWFATDTEFQILWEDRPHEKDAEKARLNYINDVKMDNRPEFAPSFLRKIYNNFIDWYHGE